MLQKLCRKATNRRNHCDWEIRYQFLFVSDTALVSHRLDMANQPAVLEHITGMWGTRSKLIAIKRRMAKVKMTILTLHC
jgi:hypothetical protein